MILEYSTGKTVLEYREGKNGSRKLRRGKKKPRSRGFHLDRSRPQACGVTNQHLLTGNYKNMKIIKIEYITGYRGFSLR